MSQQPLTDVLAKDVFDLVPVLVAAAESYEIPPAARVHLEHRVIDALVVMLGAFEDTALVVSGVKASEAFSFADARQIVEEPNHFARGPKVVVVQSGLAAIDEHDAYSRREFQKRRQGFQSETRIDDELGASEFGGHIEFSPDAF